VVRRSRCPGRGIVRDVRDPSCFERCDVRFGSVAASQQFITWAAGIGQKQTLVDCALPVTLLRCRSGQQSS
jgi:hypothetical protein